MTHQKHLRNTGLASDVTGSQERGHMKANPPQSCESRPSGHTADLAGRLPRAQTHLHESSTAPVHGVAPHTESPGLVPRLRPPPGQEAAK